MRWFEVARKDKEWRVVGKELKGFKVARKDKEWHEMA